MEETTLQSRPLSGTPAEAVLRSFAYGVSHDLRAPLRALQGFSHILQQDYRAELPNDAQRYLRFIEENAVAMSRMLDGLLEFSRQVGRTVDRSPVDLASVVSTCVDRMRHRYPARALVVDIEPLPGCVADAAMLAVLFDNLLDNAIKFSAQRETAHVVVGMSGEGACFIRDDGAGFDMRQVGRLFGIFQRLHTADEFQGIGMGLATAERIVAMHGGRMWADASPDHGATFYFTLDTMTGGGR